MFVHQILFLDNFNRLKLTLKNPRKPSPEDRFKGLARILRKMPKMVKLDS